MYGTTDQVAALARIWSHDGKFYDPGAPAYPTGTNPTATTITAWLENLSAQMDIALGTSWFKAPVIQETSPKAYAAISQYICGLASDLVHRANGVNVEVSPQGKILKDMTAWVAENSDGFLMDGVAQKESPSLKKQASFRTIGSI